MIAAADQVLHAELKLRSSKSWPVSLGSSLCSNVPVPPATHRSSGHSHGAHLDELQTERLPVAPKDPR